MRNTRHSFQKAPTVQELEGLVEELVTILDDFLNAQRGFLSEALKKKH